MLSTTTAIISIQYFWAACRLVRHIVAFVLLFASFPKKKKRKKLSNWIMRAKCIRGRKLNPKNFPISEFSECHWIYIHCLLSIVKIKLFSHTHTKYITYCLEVFARMCLRTNARALDFIQMLYLPADYKMIFTYLNWNIHTATSNL